MANGKARRIALATAIVAASSHSRASSAFCHASSAVGGRLGIRSMMSARASRPLHSARHRWSAAKISSCGQPARSETIISIAGAESRPPIASAV